MKTLAWTLTVVASACASSLAAAPRLKVSENKRFLVQEDGRPFFYLGDTAWELFHRLSREVADRYLEDRARKGFTVSRAVALAELDGHADPNPYRHHSIWQMFHPSKRRPMNGFLMPWHEALDQPGAGQMQFGRKLMESRPFLARVSKKPTSAGARSFDEDIGF